MPVNFAAPNRPCSYCENNHYLAPYARLNGSVFCSRLCLEQAQKLAKEKAEYQKLH